MGIEFNYRKHHITYSNKTVNPVKCTALEDRDAEEINQNIREVDKTLIELDDSIEKLEKKIDKY